MPLLHLLAGPNGAGKSSYVRDVLAPATHLPFINADEIAASRWPDAQAEHAYEAAQIAEAQRRDRIAAGESFISETVFSHPSKVELVSDAMVAGYLVHLHVIMVPVELTVQRVRERVRRGGHAVPEQKIRDRYDRLWGHIASAIRIATWPRCSTTAAHALRSGCVRTTSRVHSSAHPAGRNGHPASCADNPPDWPEYLASGMLQAGILWREPLSHLRLSVGDFHETIRLRPACRRTGPWRRCRRHSTRPGRAGRADPDGHYGPHCDHRAAEEPDRRARLHGQAFRLRQGHVAEVPVVQEGPDVEGLVEDLRRHLPDTDPVEGERGLKQDPVPGFGDRPGREGLVEAGDRRGPVRLQAGRHQPLAGVHGGRAGAQHRYLRPELPRRHPGHRGRQVGCVQEDVHDHEAAADRAVVLDREDRDHYGLVCDRLVVEVVHLLQVPLRDRSRRHARRHRLGPAHLRGTPGAGKVRLRHGPQLHPLHQRP
ncbi:putative ATPase [Arthrobacter crystallopoietes BAB-32]|uniref:Putative ATPase n=1 Tax=Arthrobacter crystallopoietes BAB-32 TaxID=1246476 RepID=N1V2R1_9MICC|nr:putative ATPase [Arthrobacter crystallopoietes BAB-32]